MTKNRWVVKSYGDFRHDAANVGYNDLPYLAELLKKDGYEKRVEELPFIERLISANVQPTDAALKAPVPYVIRDVTLKRGNPGQKIRVAFVGLTDGKPAGPEAKEYVIAGFRIEDPFEAAKRVLPEIKKNADIVVALAYMSREMATRLATENPEIDTIIAARQLSSMADPDHINRATVAYAFNQTKYLGELRYYVKGDGAVENQLNRYVGLDAFIPDDPIALQIVTEAHNEFTAEQNKNAQQTSSNANSTSMLAVADSPFVGVETCATCHAREFGIWEKTGHAHAMATLEKKNQHFDTECVKCHVVGFERGGFDSLVTTPQYANVQCESCHGPGRLHAANPGKGYGHVELPTGCLQCHTEPNSPDFKLETYWLKVKH